MFRLLTLSTLLFFSLTQVNAQCATPGYVPCQPAGSQLGSISSDEFDQANLWASLQSTANGAILRRDLANRLSARQNALCCSPDPDVQCLVVQDNQIPFCYNTDTTRFTFSDESYGFTSNGTYYASDGTYINYDKGYYSSTDGSTGTFAPATAAPTAAPTAAQTSGTATATKASPAQTTAEQSKAQQSDSSSSTVTHVMGPWHCLHSAGLWLVLNFGAPFLFL